MSAYLLRHKGLETSRKKGWSTSIPSYNPLDIVNNIRRLLKGEEQVPMCPWYRGFKGTVRKVGDHRYETSGIVRKVDETTVEITELPIHKWTQVTKAELEALCGERGTGIVKVQLHTRDELHSQRSSRITKNTIATSMFTSLCP